jgi:Protein of unknown function (DUF973)
MYAMAPTPSPATSAVDQSALSNVILAAILGLVGALLSLVELFSTSARSFVNVANTGTGTSVSLDLTGLYLVAALGGVGLAFVLIELWLYREAFRTLTPVDGRFSTPATLVLVALIALVLLILVAIGLLAVVYQAIVCAGSGNPITSVCISPGELLGLLAVLVVVAIVALVGYIGLLLGIWRLGTRYGDSLFKVGAILLIFPVLNIVGVILILVAARTARSKIGAYLPAPSFS